MVNVKLNIFITVYFTHGAKYVQFLFFYFNGFFSQNQTKFFPFRLLFFDITNSVQEVKHVM